MADPRPEFEQLMADVQAGAPGAAERLYEEYGPHVLRVIRRRLHQRLRSQYDSTDFLQSVMGAFFAVPRDQAFAGPADLIDFLAQVAANKVTDVFRKRMLTAKHDLNREKFLDEVGPVADPAAEDPTPSQALIADECWDRLTANQPPAMIRVLDLLRAGHTVKEAAELAGLHPKAVQRKLSKLTGQAEGDGP